MVNEHFDEITQLQNGDILTLLETVVRLYTDAPAIATYTEGRGFRVRATYQELLSDIRCSAQIVRDNWGVDHHIILNGKNSYEWFVLFCGIVVSGNIAIPVDADTTTPELKDVIACTDADFVFCDHAIEVSCPCIGFDSLMQQIRDCRVTASFSSADNKSERCSVMLGTSGSTSMPKYCMLSQRNIITAALNLFDAVPVPQGGKALVALPLNHCFGLNLGMFYMLLCGSVISMDVPRTQYFQALSIWEPKYLMCTPAVVSALNMYARVEEPRIIERVFSQLDFIYCGGAPIPPQTVAEVMNYGTRLLFGYGLTECSPLICLSQTGRVGRDGVGKVCRWVDMRFVNDEIEVQSPAVMLGYYKNRQATEEVMDGKWLRTGDLGYLNDEDNVILTGRKKNVIVLPTGENVSPEELEALYLAHDSIDYCKVYMHNHQLFADVYAPRCSVDEVLQITEQVNKSVSAYKRISRCVKLTKCPQTTVLGKVIRHDTPSQRLEQ